MTSSVLDARPASSPLDNQRPRICTVPPALSSAGAEAVDLAASAGLKLDPWQAFVLDQSLGENAGHWAAFEVALIVSRQNGKGAILEARELAGLFLFDEQLILHSAHEFKTSADAFRRIRTLVEDNPQFARRVKRIRTANGSEMIELNDGKRLQFIARSKGSGRGFSADLVILDEAYNLGSDEMAALLPTLSARPNPQVWYTSTAGMETSTQLARVRERGIAGGDPSLAFFEWSVDEDAYDPADPREWARANPGLGIRISREYVERERAALDPDAFARERLGVGVYPTDLSDAWQVISRPAWLALLDGQSVPEDPVVLVADATPGGGKSAIGVCGARGDGLMHVEVTDHLPGTAWVVPRIVELDRKHSPCAVVVDPSGPLGSIITDLEQAGIEVLQPSARDAAQACGQFREAVEAGIVRHRGDPSLMAALGGASTRLLADAWAWDRKTPVTDICPLVAVTYALWAHKLKAPLADAGVWVI